MIAALRSELVKLRRRRVLIVTAVTTLIFSIASAAILLASVSQTANPAERGLTFAELVTGQTRETVGPRPGEDQIGHHLTVLDEKTAALIDTCARYAGIFSGASESEIGALRRYGRAVGMAFQI